MAKQKLSAKAVAADIRSGMSNAELMDRYSLSAKGLESLFRKLIENRVLTEGEISQIARAPSRTVHPESPDPPAEPPTEPLRTTSEPLIDPKLAEAVVEGVRSGAHDYDMMVRLRLGRDELRDIMENLVRVGQLSAEEVEARKPRKTKQCLHCGGEVLEDATRCEHCGRDLNQAISSGRPIRPHMTDRGTASENLSSYEGCSWDDYWKNRGDLGVFRAYFRTMSQCLSSPADFFSNMPLDYGYWAPMLFGAIATAVPLTLYLVLLVLLTSGAGSAISVALFGFLGILVFVSVGLLIWSSIVHGSLMLLGCARSGFQATLRVLSYSCMTSLFCIVPVIGSIVGALWGLYLGGIGIRQTHETNTGKAFGAVLAPYCVLMAVGVAFGLHYGSLTAGKQSSSATKLSVPTVYAGTEYRTKEGRFSVVTPSPLEEKKVTM